MIMSDEQYAVVAAKDAEIASLRRTVGMGETAIRNLTAEVAALERVLAHTVLGRDRAMARVAVLEAALREIKDDCDGGFIPCDRCGFEVQMKDCDMHYSARAALSQPAATGEGT